MSKNKKNKAKKVTNSTRILEWLKIIVQGQEILEWLYKILKFAWDILGN